MFEIKKIIGSLLMPLPLLGIITLLMVFLAITQRRKALYLGFISVLSLLIVSTPYVGQTLIVSSNNPQWQFNKRQHSQIDNIVVLGCTIMPHPQLVANNQLGDCAISRLLEGVKLAHQYPDAILFVSGGGFANTTNSQLMFETAKTLGIAASRIKQNPLAMDTAEEAKRLAIYLVDKKSALVTSASHMPRAKDLFNAQGIEVIPAATDYKDYSQFPMYKQFIPSADVLVAVTRVSHEKVGSLWIKLRRWIDPEAL
ncbi:YdcF family protein [Pseudoalteromonas lipolytica]|uniref:YdcF family protein n=1 Tax=Pseudoalteromonas lipolytica TaxID=570156 RepID=A0AAD0S0A6_9GAMM|nr:ElyC/SanA/YdcF family protein [Pseudoalteromonas donghaensis]AXV65612.1 YdcF family protein [Pseudoalteromonas donghaensis]